jgi:alpha-beta hydrolase superfamily lysophospholipase
MKYEESSYTGYDGTQMFMSVWTPDDERPRALMIAIHGLGSHGSALRNIGVYLSERGIAVFAPDMRGFGHYSGLKGHVMDFDEYVEDMDSIVTQVKKTYPSKLTFLFGHSLGGLQAIRYLVTYPDDVDGLILSCPAVSEQVEVGKATRVAGSFLSFLNIKRYFSWPTQFQYASHDPDVAREHENDSLRFDKVTPRLGISALKAAHQAFESAPRIVLPVLVQQAGDDVLVLPEKSKLFFDGIGGCDKTWKLYEGLYHELHSETAKEQVLGDMYAWLEKRLTE